jgi:hypothetical protein
MRVLMPPLDFHLEARDADPAGAKLVVVVKCPVVCVLDVLIVFHCRAPFRRVILSMTLRG